jgi:hypothetical protein
MNKKYSLILGDVLALAMLTYIGFASHGKGDFSFLPRMSSTYFPMLVGWFLLAPWLGLFDHDLIANFRLLWRVPLALLFTAPLASILRSAILQSAAQPIFTLVLGLTFALGMLLWRLIWALGRHSTPR